MAKNSITDYSKTASLNTDIQSVDIDEGCLPSGINNAIREIMADLAAVNDGTVSLTSPSFSSVNIDAGTIDGTVIGGTTAAAGSFTTFTSNGIDDNATSTAVTLDSAGNVGIGETNAASYGPFVVTGTGAVGNFNASSGAALVQLYENGAGRFGIQTLNGSAGAKFTVAGTEAMRIDSSGRLGIGCNSPAIQGVDNADDLVIGQGDGNHGITISSFNTSNGTLAFIDTTNATVGRGFVDYDHNVDAMSFGTLSTERMRITNAGLVGIGTSSPSKQLHQIRTGSASDLPALSIETGFITQSTNATASSQNISIISGNAGEGRLFFGDTDDEDIGNIIYNHTSNFMSFDTAGSERLRIASSGNVQIDDGKELRIYRSGAGYSGAYAGISMDAGETIVFKNSWANKTFRYTRDGDLLVGTTDSDMSNNSGSASGFSVLSGGVITNAVANNPVYYANRLGSDGNILEFRKDGTQVGTIGAISSRPYISTGYGSDSGLRFDSAFIAPCTTTGSGRDNAIDLGDTGNRFKDLYLSSGVYLGGTGSANKLDDYEEGTWTPYFSATSGTGTVTYAVQYGYYTKIGDIVYAHGRLQTSFWGTGGSGELFINGLPFDSVNNLNGYGSLVIGFTNNWLNSPSGGHCPPNNNNISLRKRNATSAQADLDTTLSGSRGTDVNSVGNDIIFSITYKAS